jgi:hypothetical protein
MLHAPGDFELPRLRIDRRLFAEIEDRPVLDLVLANGKLGASMTVGRTRSLRGTAFELDVDARGLEGDLAFDVAAASLHE